METLKYNFSLISITESGTRTEAQLDDAFPGYKSFYSPPISNKGGVVVYYLSEMFDYVKIVPEL